MNIGLKFNHKINIYLFFSKISFIMTFIHEKYLMNKLFLELI